MSINTPLLFTRREDRDLVRNSLEARQSQGKKQALAILDNYILSSGEKLGEHVKYCNECPVCKPILRLRSHVLMNDDTIAGVPYWQVVLMRSDTSQRISNYFPNKSEIIDPLTRDINRDTFIVCQLKGFNDQSIKDYFGIKSDRWNKFKMSYFKDWRQRKEEYLADLGPEAWDRWKEKHPDLCERVHANNVSYIKKDGQLHRVDSVAS